MEEEIVVNGNTYIRENDRLKTYNKKHKIWVYINHTPEINNQIESTIKKILVSEYKKAIS